MKPSDIAKAGTEHAHQAALFCWAQQNIEKYPQLKWMHAIPNGGLRNKATAARLKAEGVKKGVADVFLPYPDYRKPNFYANIAMHYGLYIEMKKPGKGRLSEHQQEFLVDMKNCGYMTGVCETWEEARDLILAYLS